MFREHHTLAEKRSLNAKKHRNSNCSSTPPMQPLTSPSSGAWLTYISCSYAHPPLAAREDHALQLLCDQLLALVLLAAARVRRLLHAPVVHFLA
jgi:hypothetical protein